jgi:2-oxoglutarate dehydrogenase E1 component
MGPGTSFHRVIGETGQLVANERVARVVVCCGKLYHELLAQRSERGLNDVALVRIEQLYPFPAEALATEFAKYPNAEVVWCQEEPQNMGAWQFLDRRIEAVLGDLKVAASRPRYVGRREAAATATGSMKRHLKEQAELIDTALTVQLRQDRAAA